MEFILESLSKNLFVIGDSSSLIYSAILIRTEPKNILLDTFGVADDGDNGVPLCGTDAIEAAVAVVDGAVVVILEVVELLSCVSGVSFLGKLLVKGPTEPLLRLLESELEREFLLRPPCPVDASLRNSKYTSRDKHLDTISLFLSRCNFSSTGCSRL